MPLDPQARAVLDQLAALGGPPLHEMPVATARESMKMMAGLSPEKDDVASVRDDAVPGAAGEIPVRIFTPTGEGPLPVLVYFHGGGWVLGDLDTHDGICRKLANAAGCIVVSVDYRLAPENKFPAAIEDAYMATCWVAANAASVGGDPARVAIAGDSAGGNLTAAVALMVRDRGGANLVLQVPIYPVTDAGCDTASMAENADGYLLTRDGMLWFWQQYLRGDGDKTNPYAAPLRAKSFAGLAPALVVTAEFDPLRDEGEAYASALRAAGVPCELRRYDGMIHGFFGMTSVLDQARAALADTAQHMRRAFGTV